MADTLSPFQRALLEAFFRRAPVFYLTGGAALGHVQDRLSRREAPTRTRVLDDAASARGIERRRL